MILNKIYNKSTSQRSSREPSLHNSRTENNSREGSHQENLTVNNSIYESDANSDIKVTFISKTIYHFHKFYLVFIKEVPIFPQYF